MASVRGGGALAYCYEVMNSVLRLLQRADFIPSAYFSFSPSYFLFASEPHFLDNQLLI